jgi:cell division cycle protein 20 (cofactor of APC complex)
MDMDMAYYLLTEPKKDQENEGMVPPAKQAYRRLLAEKFLGGRTRILAFRNKPPEPQGMLQQISAETQTSSQINPAKQHRKIPKVCKLCCCLWTFCLLSLQASTIILFVTLCLDCLLLQFAERTLDAPGVVDDYYLNVLDWGSKNVVSIALENTLYLWNSSDSSTSELVTVDDDNGPITSVSWSCEGQHIAIGLNSSDIQLWDASSSRKVSSY